jgi:hypothetical protein
MGMKISKFKLLGVVLVLLLPIQAWLLVTYIDSWGAVLTVPISFTLVAAIAFLFDLRLDA